MAASAALQEFKATDTSTPLFVLVRCTEPVKLHFAIVEYNEEEIRSAFIEENDSCHPEALHVDRDDGNGNGAVNVLHTSFPTCKWFGVYVPDYQSGDLPIVECILVA